MSGKNRIVIKDISDDGLTRSFDASAPLAPGHEPFPSDFDEQEARMLSELQPHFLLATDIPLGGVLDEIEGVDHFVLQGYEARVTISESSDWDEMTPRIVEAIKDALGWGCEVVEPTLQTS